MATMILGSGMDYFSSHIVILEQIDFIRAASPVWLVPMLWIRNPSIAFFAS
jgi:hypothetical protein